MTFQSMNENNTCIMNLKLEKDFYISEAVSVLEDLNINLENYPVAQIKK